MARRASFCSSLASTQTAGYTVAFVDGARPLDAHRDLGTGQTADRSVSRADEPAGSFQEEIAENGYTMGSDDHLERVTGLKIHD